MTSIVPYFVYRDGAAALDWLAAAFGFERLGAYPGPDGSTAPTGRGPPDEAAARPRGRKRRLLELAEPDAATAFRFH